MWRYTAFRHAFAICKSLQNTASTAGGYWACLPYLLLVPELVVLEEEAAFLCFLCFLWVVGLVCESEAAAVVFGCVLLTAGVLSDGLAAMAPALSATDIRMPARVTLINFALVI